MRPSTSSQRSHDGERGASAIMVAASLVLLMGLAAIAVDAGIAYSERRQQSSASDVGSLAALQFAKTSLTATHPDCTGLSGNDYAACRGAEEALAVVDGTLPGRYTDAEWDACVDPDDDTLGYTQHSYISDCISFTANLQRVRVVMPGTDVDTAFAAAIGFNSIPVGAFAEAGLELDIVGGVLPFALGPTAAGQNQACFFAQDSGYSGPDKDNDRIDISPCTGSTEGNFGKLNMRWYGNETYRAGGPVCSGSTQWRMAVNILAGTDHPLEPAAKNNSTIVNDVTNCANITNPVDQIETWTGNAEGSLYDGFITGIAAPSLEGRLLCKDGSETYPLGSYLSTQCANVGNSHPEAMDHSPLWDYIRPGAAGTGSGEACAPGQLDDRASMVNCLAWWRANAGPGDYLFTEALATSPRFGAVPELLGDPGNGAGAYEIGGFKPVYLETIYWQCTAHSCAAIHSPGEPSTGPCPDPITPADTSCDWQFNGVKKIEAVSALMLTLDMLHPDVAEKFPYQDGTLVYNLFK